MSLGLKLKELFLSAILYGKTKWFHFKEQFFDTRYYFQNLPFFKHDCFLSALYLFKNPFRISKRFALSLQKDPYTYGETPLKVFETIAVVCQIDASSTFFDLGCGRARGCFWMHDFTKCEVVGIDYVPLFIKLASLTAEHFHLSSIQFRCANFFETPLDRATAIYFYAICLSEEEIKKMVDQFDYLKKGTKIVTVSFCLEEYSSNYRLLETRPAAFDWGQAELFFHEKRE